MRPAPRGELTTRRRHRYAFEFGSFLPLLIREERLDLGLSRPARLLYASDLHLGHWWTRRVPGQLVEATRQTRPDLILLGGDLADHAGALPELAECVAAMARLAPVHAVPGNHDERAGLAGVRAAIASSGGHWLPDHPLTEPLPIDGLLTAGRDRTCLLCAHYPSVFPAAREAGYGLVLAGHLHGGQCVFATVRDRLYPAVWFHRWHGLRFRDGATTMLVSRGACDTFPLRFNCPREVLLCALH